MLRNVITFYLVVLVAQALCALAEPMYITPTRIITKSTTDMDGWKTLFKRNLNEMLVARQNTGGGNDTSGSANKTLDVKLWQKETMEICEARLKNVTSTANPAGIAVCYNIASFNRARWTFLADLRLFKVSAPDKDWEAIGTDVQVGITYKAAGAEEIQLGNSTTVVTDGPQFVKEFYFGGMIYESFQKQNASDADLRQILSPDIEIIATKQDGTQLRTTVTTNEAMFITGEFQQLQSSVPSPPPPEEPFKLPGTRIEIMPIGLIFYSVYMVIGVSIVMYGTIERRKFRDQYRRRVAQSTPGASRI